MTYRLIRLLILVCLLPATAAWSKDRCAPKQRAVLTGTATAKGYEMTQQLTLTRAAGAGLYGRWMGIQLEAWMKYDRPIDRIGSKKVPLPGPTKLPDLGGNAMCYYDYVNSNTLHFRCDTGLPFDIRSSGVYWAGLPEKIGTATPAKGGTKANISIELAMSQRKNPMLATTPMSGFVLVGTSLDFTVFAAVTNRIPAPPAAEIAVTISPKPPSQQALDSMTVTASVTANTVGAHVMQVVKVPEGRRVDILLTGASPELRAIAANGVTLVTKAKHDGCPHTRQVNLEDVFDAMGLSP